MADSWFHVNRSLNAYRGCEHGCVYCDGMSEHYHIDDFTTHIRIKENASEVLRQELKRAGLTASDEPQTASLVTFLEDGRTTMQTTGEMTPRRPIIGVCGGVSDGFQPAERTYHITRRVLETLLEFETPAMILTKSDLVLDYLDLLKELHEVAFVSVNFTITLYRDEIRRIIEPNSSSTPDRFSALREIRRAGLYGGVMAIPIIPWLGDNYDNICGLVKEAKRSNAEFILFGGLTLKPGRNKDYFMRVIQRHHSDIADKLRRAYADNDRYGNPIYTQLPCNVMLRGHEVCDRLGVRDRSVRHGTRHDDPTNTAVLDTLLGIEWYQRYVLRQPWSVVRPFHELAVRIETGCYDLRRLRSEDRLAEALHTTDEAARIVAQIVDTGTCDYLQRLQSTILNQQTAE